jgi:hypothetical protein
LRRRWLFTQNIKFISKEDFTAFTENDDMTSYVLNHKGEEVI